MSYFVVNEKCNGCLSCVENCPASALRFEDTVSRRSLLHNMARCARCGQCWRICPQGAIEFQHLLQNQWDHVITLDLVRCKVCGEPIYTDDFNETLQEALNESLDALCSKHRKKKAAAPWPRLAPGRPIHGDKAQ